MSAVRYTPVVLQHFWSGKFLGLSRPSGATFEGSGFGRAFLSLTIRDDCLLIRMGHCDGKVTLSSRKHGGLYLRRGAFNQAVQDWDADGFVPRLATDSLSTGAFFELRPQQNGCIVIYEPQKGCILRGHGDRQERQVTFDQLQVYERHLFRCINVATLLRSESLKPADRRK